MEASEGTAVGRIAPATVRYIKLGRGDAWAKRCFAMGRIEFGSGTAKELHELASIGNWNAVERQYVSRFGRTPSKATDFARQDRDFYTLGSDCLWITFADGYLWWAFATPEVDWLGGDGQSHGSAVRSTIGSWSNCDINGVALVQSKLSSRLTMVAAYRQTLCQVKSARHVVDRINAEAPPVVARAVAAQAELVSIAEELVEGLHWRDFELLVDLVFARTGWQRTSELGGSQKSIDLIIEQLATGERAFVQVKSTADAEVLRGYISQFEANSSFQRMFFVCHSQLSVAVANDRVHVIDRAGIAKLAISAGLIEWLMQQYV